MKRIAPLLLVALCACATTAPKDNVDDVPTPPRVTQVEVDTKLTELQTSLTELLDRIDVLNDRIGRLEAVGAGFSPPNPPGGLKPAPTEGTVPAPQPPPQASLVAAQIADSYRNALVLVGKNRLADARKAFQDIFDADPSGDLADNALFWIGETYYVAGDYTSAMRYYARVTKEFGEQNKAPDALFKTGMAQAKTGDLQLARQTFEEVIRRYPYSSPAASAKQELKRIKY